MPFMPDIPILQAIMSGNEKKLPDLLDFDGNMLKGNMKSNTAKKLIQEWAQLHREELQANWNKAVQGEQIDRIAPLN